MIIITTKQEKNLIAYAERYMNNTERRKRIDAEVKKLEKCSTKKLRKMLERLEQWSKELDKKELEITPIFCFDNVETSKNKKGVDFKK